MHCFGIPEVPEGDWICDLCKEIGRHAEAPPCALCMVRTGAMKPTIHSAYGSTFPNYSDCQSVPKVWVHVFCARQVPGITVSDPSHFSGIDLSRIQPHRFKDHCEVCKTDSGACLLCSYKKCKAAYHPECGKSQFIETRARYESDDVRLYCNLHKPSKLRRQLIAKEKKHVDEVLAFSKNFEEAKRTLDPRKKRKRQQEVVVHQLDRPFTIDEDFELEMKLERALRIVRKNSLQRFTVSFRLNSKSKRGQASVEQPRYYTLVAPEVILKDRLQIEGRSVSETFVHYKEKQYPRLKRELEATSLPLTVYRNRVSKFFKSEDKKMPRKSQAKKQPDNFILTQVIVAPPPPPQVAAVISEDLYCVCRRPYIEMIAADPSISAEEFQAQQLDESMMRCDRCDDWFHWGCMRALGYSMDLLTDKETEFYCPNCSPKRMKQSEEGEMIIDEPVLS